MTPPTRPSALVLLTAASLALLAASTSVLFAPRLATAADHIDGPSVEIDPPADITDLFAWMSPDGERLNLVLTTFYAAGPRAAYSPAVQHVFHVASGPGYGDVAGDETILCQFYTEDAIECWAGDEYVEGDPSDPAGLVSSSGRLRVFAALRDDPFFMELAGFKETVRLVVAAAPTLDVDDAMCPLLSGDVQSALVAQLQSGVGGAPPSDTLLEMNVLALVVQIDPDLVDDGGPTLAVWASTHAAPSAP